MSALPVSILCVGDLHIMESNLDETLLLLQKLLEIVRAHRPALVVLLGDTLDRHELASSYCHVMAYDFIVALTAEVPVALLIGNHDIPHREDFLSRYHFFQPHRHIPRLTLVEKPCLIEVAGLRLGAIPYVPNGRLQETLAMLPCPVTELDALLGHQEVKGCQYRAGGTSSAGDAYNPQWPLFICGHIHTHHRLGPNVIYVGTPRAVKFGETDSKSVSLFTFETKGQQPRETRLELGLPPRLEFRLPVEALGSWQPPEAGILKVVIWGTYGQLRGIEKHPQVIAWKKRGIMVANHYVNDAAEELFYIEEDQPSVSAETFDRLLMGRFENEPRYLELYRQILETGARA